MSKDRSFKVGDVVRLASGGPTMTVVGVGSNGDVYCGWFHSNSFSSAVAMSMGRREESWGEYKTATLKAAGLKDA